MGSPSLEGLLAEGHRLDRAEKKLRAIFRNMAEHNAINLSGVGNLKVDSMDDYGLRTSGGALRRSSDQRHGVRELG